jgi:ketosteroid isomerase-like protein
VGSAPSCRSSGGRDTRQRMSQQNVELVRRDLEGLNAAGWDPAAALALVLHPEVRIYPPAEGPGPEVYEGEEGRAALIREWTSTFDHLRAEIERLIDDGDRVIALLRMRGRGKASGVEVDWSLGFIASDFSDGGAREVRWFMSTEQTLAAAGMEWSE